MVGNVARIVEAADGICLTKAAAIQHMEDAVEGKKIPPRKRRKPTGVLAPKSIESQVVSVSKPAYEQLGFP